MPSGRTPPAWTHRAVDYRHGGEIGAIPDAVSPGDSSHHRDEADEKNGHRHPRGERERFVAGDDLVQTLDEDIRREAVQNLEPPSWALERVRRYGVAGLFPGAKEGFPVVLYAQSVPRPAWSGRKDFHQE